MFWIKVDVADTGKVIVTTHGNEKDPRYTDPMRRREGSTVSQALRSLAAAMVTAKAELTGNDGV